MKSLRFTLLTLVSAGLLALCALVLTVAGGAYFAEKAVQKGLDAKDVLADVLPPPLYLVELRLVLGMAVDGTMAAAQAEKEYGRLAKEYGERVDFWTKNPPYGLEVQLLGEQHSQAKRFLAAAPAVLKAAAAADRPAALTALQQAHTAYLAHRAGVDATVTAANSFATASLASFQDTQRTVTWLVVGVFTVAAIGLMLLGLWALRSVLRATGGEPAEVARIANAVAAGDLSVQVTVRPGDQSSVMAAMGRMCETLRDLVTQVRVSSDAIASGSLQIAGGNQDLSVRTEKQAASLQQTASAMDEFSGTVQNSADTARVATQLAGSASAVAQRGAQVVNEVVATMQDISLSSRRIGEITSVIDGIAFQTNILALNAAVEAARAGEQGRGFAVVASEVRSLAQRSATAAKEINGLIGQSVHRVQTGTKLVADAGATMKDIVEQVTRVTDLIGEISNATGEQTQGIGMVSAAMSQLDSATQQNSKLVEHSAAAADALKQQAEELVRTVGYFRLQAV